MIGGFCSENKIGIDFLTGRLEIGYRRFRTDAADAAVRAFQLQTRNDDCTRQSAFTQFGGADVHERFL